MAHRTKTEAQNRGQKAGTLKMEREVNSTPQAEECDSLAHRSLVTCGKRQGQTFPIVVSVFLRDASSLHGGGFVPNPPNFPQAHP